MLSGGSGTRLWPLSNGVRSKQFLKVLRDGTGKHVSMVQRTFSKVRDYIPDADVTIATCAEQASMIAEQVQGSFALAVEPSRRDTAPAIMLACAHVLWEQHADPADPVIVLPIDSYVDDAYYEGLSKAADAVQQDASDLVLIGVEPTYPSEKYGYIVPRVPTGPLRPVDRFVEKPSADKAEFLIQNGALWNCGVFAFGLEYVMRILGAYGNYEGYADLRSRYSELPKNSFDYEVVERAHSISVVPYAGNWKDLGTWSTLTEEMPDTTSGRVVVDGSSNTHVINELDLPLVVSGVPNAVVVATVGGILVCAKDKSAGIKPLVEQACSSVDPRWQRWYQNVDEEGRAQLDALVNDKQAFGEAFDRELHFGTGGIREPMGIGPALLNRYTIARISQGLANWLVAQGDARPSVVIARDTREHGEEFERETTHVLAANGARPLCFSGPVPTPVLSFAVRELGCAAGVVITASHNARQYNGFKVYGPDGCQATTEMCSQIQAAIEAVDIFKDVKRSDAAATIVPDDVLGHYRDAVLGSAGSADCSGLRIAYSPLCGTGLKPVLAAFANLGVSREWGNLFIVSEQEHEDGVFSTCPKPNPELAEAMDQVIALAQREGCDLALATDPDADRLGVAVPDGDSWRLLTGNEVGVLLLSWLVLRAEREGADLSQRVAATTIVTTPLADVVAERHGFELRRTLTGFKFIGEQIGSLERQGRESDFLFGLEESLGYLAGSYVRDKDGVEAAVLISQLAAELKQRGVSLTQALDELGKAYGFCAGKQLSIPFEGKEGASRMSGIMATFRTSPLDEFAGCKVAKTIDYLPGTPMPVVNATGRGGEQLPPSNVIEWRLEGGSRVLLRPSGTEPKLKAYLYAYGATEDDASALLDAMATTLRSLISEMEFGAGRA